MPARLLALVLLLAAPAAGQVSLELGMSCTGELDAERSCLLIEASAQHLTDVRNEITRTMVAAGGGDCGGVSCYVLMVCDQCSADKGIEGCAEVDDRVVMHRWAVMAHRVGCLLTVIRAQALERAAETVARQRVNRAADIGTGPPLIVDERAAGEEP